MVRRKLLNFRDISKQRTIKSIQNAHNGFINGVCFDKVTKEHFYTIGTDKYLKRWKYKGSNTSDEPIQVYQAEYGLYCIDFHQDDNYLITGGDKLDLWDSNRSIPKQSFEPCMDSILSCKFNPVEKSLVLLSARNNGLYLYDIKSGTGISEFFMNKRTNQVCWNPMNPFVFSIANDDLNSYTFDMRKLEDGPTHMHVGHLGSVMSIDYSPTGQEFVTGSYDKTIRIYRTDTTNYNSREVYHTNRMQRVFQVKYTLDSRFILSSSDDYIVRIWKSKSSDPLRHTTIDEREKIEYNEKLIEKFKKLPEIRKISNQKYLPNKLYQEKKQYQQEREALERKEEKMNKKVIKSGGKIEKTNAMKKNFKGVSE